MTVEVWMRFEWGTAHLSVPDHYHADKDNVDVGTQRFIMVDFINLKGNEKHNVSWIWTMKKKQHTMRLIKVIDDVVQYTDEACRADADQ